MCQIDQNKSKKKPNSQRDENRDFIGYCLSRLVEPRKLKVWVTYNDEQFRVYQRLVKDFKNQNKVEISISRIPFQGQGEKIMYACNSRRAPDIPYGYRVNSKVCGR